MIQEQTMSVRHAYGEFGLQAPALNREPEDQRGLELVFVGELAVTALNAGESSDVGGQTGPAGGDVEVLEGTPCHHGAAARGGYRGRGQDRPLPGGGSPAGGSIEAFRSILGVPVRASRGLGRTPARRSGICVQFQSVA